MSARLSISESDNAIIRAYIQTNTNGDYIAFGASADTNNERTQLYVSNRMRPISGNRAVVFDSYYHGSWFSVILPESFSIEKTTFTNHTVAATASNRVLNLPTGCVMIGHVLSGSGFAECCLTQGDSTSIWMRNNGSASVTISGTIYYIIASGI